MKNSRYIYINIGDCSVLESQVLELIQYVRNNYNIDVLLLQGYQSEKEKERILQKLAKYHIPVQWFRSYPKYWGIWWLTKQSFLNLWKSIHVDSVDFFHARGFESGVLVKQYLTKKNMLHHLLVDVRGVPIEEHELYGKNSIKIVLKKFFYLEIIKQLQYKQQPKITVVSNTLKMYLIQKYNFEDKMITIHPNICSKKFIFDKDARTQIRKDLNIQDGELLFVCSTGGGAAWQNDQELLMKIVDTGCKILNLSPHQILHPNICNMVVPFEQMPKYLSAADVAILWREDNPVNNVASPSKFSEFATMGLYVIHNGTVGLAEHYINTTKAGCIISNVGEFIMPDISYINEHRDTWIKQGAKWFGIANISHDYLKVLNVMNNL